MKTWHKKETFNQTMWIEFKGTMNFNEKNVYLLVSFWWKLNIFFYFE